MNKLFFTIAYFAAAVAFAGTIEIESSRDAAGQRRIDSRVISNIPELGYVSTELIFHGVVAETSTDSSCHQFLIPGGRFTLLAPSPLKPDCKVEVLSVTAFQCPGDTVSITVMVDGPHCEATLDLVKTLKIQFTGNVTPEEGPDIEGLIFNLNALK